MSELTYASILAKKRLRIFTVIATLAILFGITFYIGHTPALQGQNHSNSLTISGPWEFTSYEPSKHGYIYTRMQVIETLVNVDEHGRLAPGLATQWRPAADNLSWEFTLRDNVQFHDGSSMTAQSVVSSLQHNLSKHGVLRRVPIKSIESIDARHIRINLTKPYPVLAAVLTNYSTAILSTSSYSLNNEVIALNGTGPYKLARFEPPHKLIVRANHKYWGYKPTIEFASYLTGHRAESRILQAKSGEADIVFTVDPAMISQLGEQANVTLINKPIPRTLVIQLNSQHPFLQDIGVRQALSYAINRTAIANNILHTPGAQTLQLLPEFMSDWYLKNIPNDEYSLSKAKALIASQGWKPNQEGWLEKNGQRFQLTMMTYADRPELTTVATAIQAQWAEIGVELKINVTNSSMIPAGHKDGSLEVALSARNYGTTADPLPLMVADFANGGGDWGAMGWNNAEVDSAFEKLEAGQPPEIRSALSHTISRQIYEQKPVLPLTHYHQLISVNKRVKNFKFDPYERNYLINRMEIAQ